MLLLVETGRLCSHLLPHASCRSTVQKWKERHLPTQTIQGCLRGRGRKIKTSTANWIGGQFKSMKLESPSLEQCHKFLLKENLQATTILLIYVWLKILNGRNRSIIYSWHLFKFTNIHSVISATRRMHFYRNESNFVLVCNTHAAYLHFLWGCSSQDELCSPERIRDSMKSMKSETFMTRYQVSC